LPFVTCKKIILEEALLYKNTHQKSEFNILDKRTINNNILLRLEGNKPSVKPPKLFLKHVQKGETIKKILASNIMELYPNIEWQYIDWSDSQQVNSALME